MTQSPAPPADARARITGGELRAVLVGGTAFLILAVVLIVSYMGAGTGGAATGYTVVALFNRVDGLAVGDDVQVAGVPVGDVVEMTLGNDYRARLSLRIADDVPLPVDTSAAIHTDGLFGRKFVVLEPGGADEMLQDGGAITFTQDSLIVSDLLDLVIAEGRGKRTRDAADEGAAEGAP